MVTVPWDPKRRVFASILIFQRGLEKWNLVCLHRWHRVLTYQGNAFYVSFSFLSRKTFFVCLSLSIQIWLTSPGTIPENLPCEATHVSYPNNNWPRGRHFSLRECNKCLVSIQNQQLLPSLWAQVFWWNALAAETSPLYLVLRDSGHSEISESMYGYFIDTRRDWQKEKNIDMVSELDVSKDSSGDLSRL